MFLYKIREYGDDRAMFSKSFRHPQQSRPPQYFHFAPFGEAFEIEKKSKKSIFFKMSQFFTSTMIIENTQLGKVFSLLKGLE